MILSIDLETRSRVDLKKAGAYRYFESNSTDILCLAWAIDDGPVEGWTPGQPCPPPVVDLITGGGFVSGWNVNFERQGFNRILGPRHGWPVPKMQQYQCTAAQAAAQALPRALEKAADVLRLPERKDLAGAKLMKLMSKPRKDGSWYEGDLDRLLDYCKDDVAAERAVRNKLKPLSESEMLLWRLDQLINDRGITLDLGLVDDMLAVVSQQVERLDDELARLTGDAVEACTQTERLKAWLKKQGVEAKSLAKGVIDEVLAQPMPAECHQAILTWQEASLASVRKLQAAKHCVGGDGRARGLLLFHGASTGRWSGQLLQPQNMVRGSGLVESQDEAIAWLRLRSAAALEFAYGRPLTVVSDCLRGIMTAAKDRHLVAGDFKNIESRLIAWMSGNTPKLRQFEVQDAHPDNKRYEVYTLAAASIYNKEPVDISKDERQAGKVAELALGFGGGVNALVGMAMNYHVDLAAAWPGLWAVASVDERDHVRDRYNEAVEKGNTTMGRDAWEASALIVRAWRRAHKPTVDMWDTYHSAAWHALEAAGVDHKAGMIVFRREGGFMWMTLPSGRRLAYPTPAVESREVPWSDKRLKSEDRERRDMLTVLAFEQGKKFRYPFYPGITFQHSVQAAARDILAHGMLNAEKEGFPIVMSVHDEAIAEIGTAPSVDLDRFLNALCDIPDWAAGLPLVADGWRGYRYRKAA